MGVDLIGNVCFSVSIRKDRKFIKYTLLSRWWYGSLFSLENFIYMVLPINDL
jgi:hypothetical protein